MQTGITEMDAPTAKEMPMMMTLSEIVIINSTYV